MSKEDTLISCPLPEFWSQQELLQQSSNVTHETSNQTPHPNTTMFPERSSAAYSAAQVMNYSCGTAAENFKCTAPPINAEYANLYNPWITEGSQGASSSICAVEEPVTMGTYPHDSVFHNILQWLDLPPDEFVNKQADVWNDELLRSMEVAVSNGREDGAGFCNVTPLNDEASSILDASYFGEKNTFFKDTDLFGSEQSGVCYGNIQKYPSNTSSITTESLSGFDDGSKVAPRKGQLFSELGLEWLLEDVVGKTNYSSSCEDQSVYCSHVVIQADKPQTLASQMHDNPKNTTKRRGRAGGSSRPRPKDRQLIQDRLKELKEIIPNSGKLSIDALLDRTIKHMVFLQSVRKYGGDRMKRDDKPKSIGGKDGVVGGATWGYEVGGETPVCPIIVEDLGPPGQMLIEMVCEEEGGLFVEIADIIRGFRLRILKGLIEVEGNKLWARFTVEANEKITRMDVFVSLVHRLQQVKQ